MSLSLGKQLISPQNMFSILIFESPVLKRVMTLVGTTYRKVESRQSCRTDEDKGARVQTIVLIFTWNIVLHDSSQAYEIVTEIEEWKQKVLGVRVKSFSRVLKCAGGISCILKKLC